MRFRPFIVGAVIGLAVSLVLVALDPSLRTLTFGEPTLWQRTTHAVLAPGVMAGWSFYDCCDGWFSTSASAEKAAVALGCVTVAGSYGVIALAISAVVRRLRR